MSERLPTQNPNTDKSNEKSSYAEVINSSIETLQEKYGLDLEKALKAGERKFTVEDVKEQAEELADNLELDKKFFGDDSRKMFLLMVAESLCGIEEIPEDKQDAEMNMLIDFILLVGGKYSKDARNLVDSGKANQNFKSRYMENITTPFEKRKAEFLNWGELQMIVE